MAKRRGSKKGLNAEDLKLWEKVTATVTPKKSNLTASQTETSSEFQINLNAVAPPDEKRSDPSIRQSAFTTSAMPKPAKPLAAPAYKPPVSQPKPSKTPAITSLQKREKSRLSRGIRHIDGRIDLHGMTQREAHAALLTFIGRAYASGWRTIIVITGKGLKKSPPNHRGSRQEFTDLLDSRAERGVLRKRVPEWLSDPKMRPYIVGFDEAAPNHGGSGALYVQLRTKKT